MDAKALGTVRAEFIEKIGIVAQGEGMPRIAGRLFALLVFDGGALSFGSLAEELQVSRASISTSARLLEERGLVRRVSRPGERQDYFQLADDAYAGMLRLAVQRALRARSEIEATLRDLPETEGGARGRLTEYVEFYSAIEAGLTASIDRIGEKRR